MGLLMFLGMIGSIAYSGHVIKNDIESEIIDKRTKPTFNSNMNQNTIRNNFKGICKRSRIKLDNDGNPISDQKLPVAVEYLRYQGYAEEDINEFKKLFNLKVKNHQRSEKRAINLKNQRLKNKLQNNPANDLVVLRRRVYKSNLQPLERINKLLENDLWNEIVDHQTYIRSDGSSKWEEIWTLKVPKNFFTEISKEELYRNICKIQNVEYSI